MSQPKKISQLDPLTTPSTNDIIPVVDVSEGKTKKLTIQAIVDLISIATGAIWGSITGLLSDQTDLKNALDAKSSTGHSHTAANVTDFNSKVSLNGDVTANTAARHSHTNKVDLDKLSGTNTGDQDLTGLVAKRSGYDLSKNDYSDTDKNRLKDTSGENTGDETGVTIVTRLGYTPENAANKGAASGYASLDTGVKIPVEQLPDAVLGTMRYQGVFNATGSYPSNPTKGHYYVCNVAGTIGGVDYQVGDWTVYNGSGWDKIDNSDKVSSVDGGTGNIDLTGKYQLKEVGKGLSANDYSDSEKNRLANTSGTNTGDQDLSGLVEKVTGYGLSKNDFDDTTKNRLANTSGTNSGDQTIPAALSDLTSDSTHRLVTDTEKSTWNAKQDAGDFATHTELSSGLAGKQNAGNYLTSRTIVIPLTDDDTAPTVATNFAKFPFVVPESMNGMNIVDLDFHVTTGSTSGTPTFQVYNKRSAHNVLSTAVTIDINETDSKDAAVQPVIDPAYDELQTGDELRFDCSVVGTGTKGVQIRINCQLP